MDKYDSLRSLSLASVAGALGIDLGRFKNRKDGELYGPCPVHKPKHNQTGFSYAADGRYHCFSCDAKGKGAIDLTMAVLSVNFTSAVEILGRLTIEPPKQQKPQDGANLETGGDLQPLAKDTWRKFAVACPWLEQRIPDAAVRERYGVFCYNNPARRSAYSGRVMLPVKDSAGQLFGYLGRAIPATSSDPTAIEGAKYLFPKNLPKSRFLFGAAELMAHQSQPLLLRIVYLVESPFCVMKFAMYGIPAVSPFGWSVSTEHLELLTKVARGIVYLPDKNKYAEGAAVVQHLSARLWLRFPPLPDGCEDPENLTKEQILAL